MKLVTNNFGFDLPNNGHLILARPIMKARLCEHPPQASKKTFLPVRQPWVATPGSALHGQSGAGFLAGA
jgi:hypothetical protein